MREMGGVSREQRRDLCVLGVIQRVRGVVLLWYVVSKDLRRGVR